MEEDGSRKKRITIVDKGSRRHDKSPRRPPEDPGGSDTRRSKSKLSITQRTQQNPESESVAGDSESSPSSKEDSEAALILRSLQSGAKIKRSANDDALSETSVEDGAQASSSQNEEASSVAKSLPSIPRVALATCPTNTDLAQVTDMDPAESPSEPQTVLVRSLIMRNKSSSSIGKEEKELKAHEDMEERRKIASFVDLHSGLVGKVDSEGNELPATPETIHKTDTKPCQSRKDFKVEPSTVMRLETESASVREKKSTVSTQPSTARPAGSTQQTTVAAPMTEHEQQTAFSYVKQTRSGTLVQKSFDASNAKKTIPALDKSVPGGSQALFVRQMKTLKAKEGAGASVANRRDTQKMSLLLMNPEESERPIEERRRSSADSQRPSLTPSVVARNSYLLRYSDRDYDSLKREFGSLKKDESRPSTVEDMQGRRMSEDRRSSACSSREGDHRGTLLLRNRETSHVEPYRRLSSSTQPPLSRERRKSDDRSSRPSTNESERRASLLLRNRDITIDPSRRVSSTSDTPTPSEGDERSQ